MTNNENLDIPDEVIAVDNAGAHESIFCVETSALGYGMQVSKGENGTQIEHTLPTVVCSAFRPGRGMDVESENVILLFQDDIHLAVHAIGMICGMLGTNEETMEVRHELWEAWRNKHGWSKEELNARMAEMWIDNEVEKGIKRMAQEHERGNQ